MQPSSRGPRIKLNRNAFNPEQDTVPKRRRYALSKSSESECADPGLTQSSTALSGPHHRDPSRILNIPTPGATVRVNQQQSLCTLRDCNNNNYYYSNSNNLHMALRFKEKSEKQDEARQSAEGNPGKTPQPGSSGDETEERALSPGVSKTKVQMEVKQPGTPRKEAEAGRAAHINFKRKAGLRKRFGSRLGSGRQVKRSVKNTCCALCGDVKYTPPAPKKLACAYKAGSRCPSQPRRMKQTAVHPVAQADLTTRLIIWFRRHLKVKLCDIAHVFDVTSRDFSCVLPAMLLQKRKHKRVKCFRKEFGSLMSLDPQGIGNWGKWIGNHYWEVCSSTNSCASLSSGNQVFGFVGEHISEVTEDTEGWSDSLDTQVSRMPDCEEISSNKGLANEPLTLGKVQHCGKPAGKEAEDPNGASVVQEVQDAQVRRVPPLLLRRVNACKGLASSQHFKNVALADKVGGTDTNGNCLLENGLNSSSEGDVDSSDSFSCQRTTAYTAWSSLSCARTYRSWPFPRRGPPREIRASACTGPRWIVTTEVSEGKQNVTSITQIGFSTNSECVKESLSVKLPSESVLVPNCQGQVEKPLTSVKSDEFSQDLPTLGSVLKKGSPAVDIRFPEASSSDQLNPTPIGSVSAVDTMYVKSNSSTTNGTQCLEDNESSTEATNFHLPDPLQVLQGSDFQSLSCLARSREEEQTPTMMVHTSSVEPKQHPSEMVHPSEEEKSDTDIENRCHGSPRPTSLTCAESSTWDTPLKSTTHKDSFSCSEEDCSEEDCSLSFDERPEEGDAVCFLSQAEKCEIGKADRSPSPLPALEGSVVTGGDLDVVRAYKDDAIVLDVIQDDPDLFGAIVMDTTGNLSPTPGQDIVQRGRSMCMQTDRTNFARKTNRIVWDIESQSPRKNFQTAADVYVENHVGFCKGEGNKLSEVSKNLTFTTRWLPVNPMVMQEQGLPDCNNNLQKKESTDRKVSAMNTRFTWTVDDARNSVHTTVGKDINVVRPLPSSFHQYCRYYFSEHHSCFRVPCWFLHVPRDDDEKFCMDAVQKFCRVGNPPVVARAVEVFVAYYTTNSPGTSFSQSIMNQLLSSLLSLSLLRDLVSVIHTLLTHKRTPPPEFLMALYEHVRERGIQHFVPELILLTSKVTEMGCVFSVEQCEAMQLYLEALHVPRQQIDIFSMVKCRALAIDPHTAELSELAQVILRVEMCKQQEDWAALARVFYTVCGGRHSAGEVLRFCCCVTTALLKEPKDKLTLPYEPFAETVCQDMPSDEMVKSFLGRVGISLMFSYHRNQDWAKGLKLLCVMSRLHLEFTMLKGLFNSENGTSRCQLVTTATEFFLNSGSIEGALNILKANEWFVSSSAWPCEQADVQNRRKLLTLLAEKTSYRDTLEVLTNLPGLREPVDGVQAGEYHAMFSTHLRRCVANQVLPVAADTLEFMLTQEIPLDASEVQHVIHKLGKQNTWSRARTLFKRYYSGIVCEKDSLALSCCLTEIEMTLAFEMFISRIRTSLQNPSHSSQPLLITLKRRSADKLAMESVYLAAGCRLLSAALIPNPKLSIRYTAVNQEQEQLFNLDRGSAAKWLSHNYSWAQTMWASSHTH